MPTPMRNRFSRRTAAALAAGSLAALTACGGGDGTAAPTSPPVTEPATTLAATTPAPAPTAAAPTTASTGTAAPTTAAPTIPAAPPPTTQPPAPQVLRQPLTGQPLPDADWLINRPALVVKIDNVGSARGHHNGLGAADIVLEEIVEGNATRFAAIFHSRDSDPVGPIRSGRSQDVDLLTALRHPLFAWSGGNPTVERTIAGSPLIDLNWQHTPNTYYRGPGEVPHNLYSSTPRLYEWIPFGHPGAPPQQFAYLDEGQTFTGDPVAGVDARVGNNQVSWNWSAENHAFMRSQGGSPHIDQQHGPIGATNVVLMVVQYFPDPAETRSPMAQTIGNGPAYIFSDGKVVEARWSRYTADEPIRLQETGTGAVIPINPGNTWIELMRAGENPNGDINWPTAEFTIRPAGG